jgi:hypothetical protein
MKPIFPHGKCAFLRVGSGLNAVNVGTDVVMRNVSSDLQVPAIEVAHGGEFSQNLEVAFAALVKLRKEQDRRFVLMSGAYLEEEISFSALRGLAEGFDIHLLADTIVARNKRLFQTHLLRLFQAGTVPTTLMQSLHFWSVETINVRERECLLASAAQLLR